jgi:hypothetical protein
MATPARAKSGSRSTQARRMAKSREKSAETPFDLRRSLYSLALWGLGIINVLLIASFLKNHFSTGSEHNISSETEVITAPAAEQKIEVLNGCGVPGVAQKVADFLKSYHFDPVNVTNLKDTSGRDRFDIPRTMIFDRLSNERTYGRQVAEALGVSDEYVSYQASPDRQVSVTVVIGADYKSIQLTKR